MHLNKLTHQRLCFKAVKRVAHFPCDLISVLASDSTMSDSPTSSSIYWLNLIQPGARALQTSLKLIFSPKMKGDICNVASLTTIFIHNQLCLVCYLGSLSLHYANQMVEQMLFYYKSDIKTDLL